MGSRGQLITMTRLQQAWRRFRANSWRALIFDVTACLLVFGAVHSWQTRDLPVDLPAPATRLPLLADGSLRQDAVRPGQVGIVYFFAPWCRVCRVSIGNLDSLVASGALDWGVTIALDFADTGEVADFIADSGVTLPVLLGDGRTLEDWSIYAFPTYYVIDAAGNIDSRSVGYSSWLGMRWRAWLAAW